jgi:protein SCO1/2
MKHAKRTVLLVLSLLIGTVWGAPAAGRSEAHTAKLVGDVFSQPARAADFTLTDQNGAPFHMGSTDGKVVVLTFLYTHCTDTCPFLALKLKEAAAQLGADAGRTVFVAVTTDPARDTQKVIADYSRAVGLSDTWHFLTGSLPSVQEVWRSYGIGVSVQKDADSTGTTTNGGPEQEHGQGLSQDDLSVASAVIQKFGGGYEVAHSAPFWLIDPKGLLRVVLGDDASPDDLVTDIRALLSR